MLHRQQLIAQLSKIKASLLFSPSQSLLHPTFPSPYHQTSKNALLQPQSHVLDMDSKCRNPSSLAATHTVPGGLSYVEHKAAWKEIAESMNDASETQDLGRDTIYIEGFVLTYPISVYYGAMSRFSLWQRLLRPWVK